MNPKVLQIIEKILASAKKPHAKAGALAKEFGLKDGDIMADIMSACPDILTKLPDLAELTVGKLRQIALMLIVQHKNKTPEFLKALDYAIEAHQYLLEHDHEDKHDILHLKIFDFNIMDTLKHLTDRDEIERPCVRCPVRRRR